ncbi:MAG: DUF3786 domain-containing protein [Spirochaetaceae bacterium]|jgi:hypothetical protein|nr:DUF3786 domain-containing protein [Spirochaetaceae bacterium]
MNKRGVYEKKQQERTPFLHYGAIYKTLSPGEIAQRCSLPFDRDCSAFSLRLMGTEYRAAFPDFTLIDPAGEERQSPWEQILVLRYLCEGKYFEGRGKQLSYQEIPWGPVYYPNFRGRCINRFAAIFGREPAAFREIMENTGALRAQALGQGDAGYRFEFITGLFMSLLLWAGDDEFPPSAQILFDDNFVFAFTAEDLAVVGEVVITRLQELSKNRDRPR